MSHLRALDADVEGALEPINVPAYVIDKHGIIRWINPAGRKVVGDVRGRQYTSVCAPEETRHAREVFAQKVVGGAKVTDVEGVLIDANGDRIKVEISSVPLYSGGHIVGVFGEVVNVEEDEERPPHPRLTPRQAEVLRLLDADPPGTPAAFAAAAPRWRWRSWRQGSRPRAAADRRPSAPLRAGAGTRRERPPRRR